MMAGLLDMLNTPDGIFALGLLDAAAPRPVRTNIGAGLLQALQGAQTWQQGQDDRTQRAALQGLQMDHLRSQIAETLAQADQRKAATEDALRKAQAAAALQQRQQQFLLAGMAGGPMAGTGGPSIMTGSGQRSPEQNAQVASQAQARGFDYATAAALFGPEHAAKLMQGMNDARNFGRDKVAGTVETVIPGTNMPGTMMRDEFGRPVGAVLPKAVEMKLQDLGGSVQAVNPFALTAGQGLTKTQTPDGSASNAVAWANNALARQRFAFDQQQPRGQYDADRGVMVDPRTAQATPVTIAGNPLGPKNKELTESQSNAVSFAMRAQNALDNLARVPSISTYDFAASRVPLAGNAIMTEQGQQAMNAERQFVAAVLRKESGAAISVGEYKTYGDQFFPRPGDDRATLAQKEQNRLVALQGLMAQAGPGAKQVQAGLAAARGGSGGGGAQVIDLFKLPGAGGSWQPAQPGVIDWNSLGGR